VLPLFWCYRCFGVTVVLVLPLFWCYRCFGVTVVLVLPLFWCYRCSGVTVVLVLPLFWCYRCFGVTVVLVLPLFTHGMLCYRFEMKTVGVRNTAIKALMMIYTTYKGGCLICICSPDQVAVLQTVINGHEKHAKHSQTLHAVCKGIAVGGEIEAEGPSHSY